MKFVVFQNTDYRWYWEMRSRDAEVTANGAAGFQNIEQAFDAIRAVRVGAADAPILNLLGQEDDGMSKQAA